MATNSMEDSRKALGKVLLDILGNQNVYYQPPESIKLKYPCIVYSRNRIDQRHADDLVYGLDYSYTVTLIDTNPDSSVSIALANLPKCKFDRIFKTSGLYHTVFTIYY